MWKIKIYIKYYFWNLPRNTLWDLYWLPVTLKDWFNKETCSCGARLDIWGNCEGLNKLMKELTIHTMGD